MDTIKEPQALKAKLMLWTDVSYHDMEEIDKLQSIQDLEREHSFSKEQTSALLSIIKAIHEANVETPLDNSDKCFKYCRELLLCHSVRRPPFSTNLFNTDEANRVLTYIHNNYMRHCKLYKYIFTPQVKLDLSLSYSGPPAVDDSSVPADGEKVTNTEAVPKTDRPSSETQQASFAPVAGATSELKALIEQEIREHMTRVSGQLDQRIKEIATQHNSALDSSQNPKAKK